MSTITTIQEGANPSKIRILVTSDIPWVVELLALGTKVMSSSRTNGVTVLKAADFKCCRKAGKAQEARWNHHVSLFSYLTDPKIGIIRR